jgi:hypothetical protein
LHDTQETGDDGAVHPSTAGSSWAEPTAGWSDRSPIATAINETSQVGDLIVTVLTAVAVDDLLQVSAVLRIGHQGEVRLVGIPDLDIVDSAGGRLDAVRAHHLPAGEILWLSWTYRRPPTLAGTYAARIERIELVRGRGRPVGEVVPGPWTFEFSLAG